MYDGYHAHITKAESVLGVQNFHGKMPLIIGDGRFDDTSFAVNLADGGTKQRTELVTHYAGDLFAGLHSFLIRFFSLGYLACRYRQGA